MFDLPSSGLAPGGSSQPAQNSLSQEQAREVPLRLLAHLGDAVFELFERERQIMSATTARKLHNSVVLRVNARSQADLLRTLMSSLSEGELDVVRRARNLKIAGNRKISQSSYRLSTAFEALIGYLYLTDRRRLDEILKLTLEEKR